MNDLAYIKNKPSFLIGTDEVGRGCLAGSVVICSVALLNPKQSSLLTLEKLGIKDSKQMNTKKRQAIIKELNLNLDYSKDEQLINIKYKDCDLVISIVQKQPSYIDEVNILQATLKGMLESFTNIYDKQLNPNGVWIIDGVSAPEYEAFGLHIETIIKGDDKSLVIGLASIIAKEFRDYLMKEIMHNLYPDYGFKTNVGYGAKTHIEGIKKNGRCPIHRQSFKLAQLGEK